MKTLWAWLTGPRSTPETDPGDAYDPERDPVWCRLHGEKVAAEQGEHRAREELQRVRKDARAFRQNFIEWSWTEGRDDHE